MGENFVVADADLSPERRLQGGQGQGLSTYRELIRNLSTKTRPEGGALALVLDRWVINIQRKAVEECGSSSGTVYDQAFHSVLEAFLEPLCELVHGYDFSAVLKIYAFAFAEEDMEAKACVVKWLRGEYRTKTEARRELGVNACIADDSWYDYLKLLAEFLTGAGYKGLVVMIDELVNLYKNTQIRFTRQNNYEKILTMYNDTLRAKRIIWALVMGSVPLSRSRIGRRGVYQLCRAASEFD